MTIVPPGGAPLTAAEALVLQHPDLNQGRTALKLTLMELLARNIVTLRHEEQKGAFGRVRKTDYLHLGPEAQARAPQSPHIRAVLDMLAAAGASQTGATIDKVVGQARKTFGSDLAKFQSAHVIPALINRGLLEQYTAKKFGLFSTTRYRPTAAGTTTQQTITGQLTQARNLPTLVEHDPASAAALVATLGSMVLLVDELRPHYSRISNALRVAGSDTGDFDTTTFDTDNSTDFGSFGDFDLSSFDALDSSLDAFESSFDAADSSSDGGDSGGSSD